MVALLLGAAMGTLITQIFSTEQIEAWAWRLPFAFGLLIVPVAIYIRKNVDETEVFKKIQAVRAASTANSVVQSLSLFQMLKSHFRETLMGIGLVVTLTVSIYITFTYLTTYATKMLGLPLGETFWVQMISAAFMVVLIPVVGAWSDRVGRKKIAIVALVGYFLVLAPLYWWLTDAPSIYRLFSVQMVLCVFASAFFGIFSTVIAELFPANIRSTGLSFAYNVSVMIFGGFAQFIVTWLIKVTGSLMAPAYYVMFGIALGIIAACFIDESKDVSELEN